MKLVNLTPHPIVLAKGDPEPGLVYIVSAMVGAALREAGVSRPDVLCPGTGPQDGAIRDPEGRIQAVTRLIRATLL